MSNHGAPVEFDAESLIEAFRKHETGAGGDPHINAVARLSSEIFLALETRKATVAALGDAVQHLGDDAFEDRAIAFHQRRTGVARSRETLDALALNGFEKFRAQVERAQAGVVFTAHPTFALGAAKRDLIARYPSGDKEQKDWRKLVAALDRAEPDKITLRYEHDVAQRAIANARGGLRRLNETILSIAKDKFPKDWDSIRPAPLSLATWVGYDLDGRSDIHWSETIRIRIAEKASQLQRYVDLLDDIIGDGAADGLQELHDTLAAAVALASAQTDAFGQDLSDPEAVVAAANLLTGDHEGRLTSLASASKLISEKIKAADSESTKSKLILLRAEMDACGLGIARIHLRVNAAQVRSALRADLGLDPDTGFLGRSALDIAAEKSTAAQQRAVNFGSVFLEKMTARRQFMLCAQILKHIDAETPIRFLIAECEAPATVMGAVYLARLYGVEKKLDISPLFETPQALESGGRFLERLLRESEYRDYITGRGRMSIQLGFSDSGRFMGQCAAGLAIERLQVLFARALADAKMTHIEALVFNTHGESMGRGAHSGNFVSRLDHLATPWVRSRFAKNAIALAEECSFQGGEGYLHFETPELAAKTVDMVWAGICTQDAADYSDGFYKDINYSWDFYRGLKTWQESLFQRPDYRLLLSGFAQRLLFKTGSRQAKRAKGGGFDLSALRAIPHNAILQQLGAPVNVSGGFGAAAGREMDRLVEHIGNSARMQQLTELAAHARALTDLTTLRAYAAIYAPTYWASLAVAAGEGKKAEGYEEIQQALAQSGVSSAFHQFADFLSLDLRRFDGLLAMASETVESAARERLAVLHAIRQALMAHAVSRVAMAPAFSKRHDVAHQDLILMVLDWRLEETVDLLRVIFPARAEATSAFSGLEEAVDDHEFERGAYPEVHADIIEPLVEIAALSHQLSQAIAHHYGAFG